MSALASAFLMPGDLYVSTVQKLYFEMRKECKATLVANRNERLEGDDYLVKAFKESKEPSEACLLKRPW